MPPKDATAQGPPGGGGPGRGGDRLSGLKDKVLLRVMSHLKAWEAVRTCMLSSRWRNLWASNTHLDIRHPCGCPGGAAADQFQPEAFANFVKNLLLRRRPLARLDSLRLCWSHDSDDGDADFWIAYAVRHGAEEIELSGKHHHENPSPKYMSFIVDGDEFIQARLRILKLIHIKLDATILTQLCSRCTCLKELELNDCYIPEETKIQPILLEGLTMIRCKIMKRLSVYAPNLVALLFSRNFGSVPWIQNLGLLAASNIKQRAPHDQYRDCSGLGSCNLKILKLLRVKLDDTTFAQLCSRCTALEELELEDCSVEGEKIGSTSLKYLTMISCKIATGFRVQTPNLVLLCCIQPFQYFPQIQKMEFLVTATIVLDDSCLLSDCPWLQEDDSDDNCNDESDHDSGDNEHNESDGSSNYYDSDRSAPSDEEDGDRTVGYSEISMEHKCKKYKYLINGHKRSANEPKANCYGKYASEVSTNSGGVGMLLSLSHVKRMDLLAHPEEVQYSHLADNTAF
ncbi:hypothetical protein BAE44_0016591 [Dichanthelium oligosanthes]|uniref:F-box domain-containing protein n=1 Tax=Dichanthelium oligosanthes TaxID=888268 RepID=A0A1E5VB59_9POAL|nr:hypothetical protein BAE44_0016591 [Dichanthelium oligosanthes]